MRRVVLFCLATLLGQALIAQPQRGILGNYHIDNYPEVSFVWNAPNPDALEKSMFILTDEEGKNIDFRFKVLPEEKKKYKKSVLFLWEDMRSHSNQSENTRKLLAGFFGRGTIDENDQFNVAVFNRKSTGEKYVLKKLSPEFTSNTSNLVSLIEEYPKSSRIFKASEYPKATDLYLAINEGIDLLKTEPSDRLGIIVVVTAGLNLKAAGASTEMETVRKNAVDAGIPVYVVHYHEPFGEASEVNSLANSTYGRTMWLTNNKTEEAVNNLKDWYREFDVHAYGHDYEITFTTDAKRDGKPHNIKLFVNKVEQAIPAFTAPDMTLGIWVKEHLVLFIILVVLLVGVIILVAWLIHRAIVKRNMKMAEHEAAMQNKINQQDQVVRDLHERQERERQEREAEEIRKNQEAEDAQLMRLMQVKNLYPRLQCQVAGTSFTYSMDKPHITIGRNESSDLVLNIQSVSGFHAEINFTGTAFELTNKSHSYKQGIVVNGQLFQQCTLRSGDKICLGEALVTFYV